MIRPVTLVTFAAFIGSGLYLYQVKHQAQLVDRQIQKVRDATDAARARAGLLRADYALLNDPDRLAELATSYLPDLKPTQPGQWSAMAEIDRRLPPLGGPTAEPAPLEPPTPARAESPPMAARAGPAPVARTEPPKAPPAIVASMPEPASPPRLAPQPTPAPAPFGARRPASRVAAAAVAARAAPAPPQVARALPATPPVQIAPAIVQVASAPPPPRAAAAPAPLASLLPRVSPPAGASLLAIAARPLPPPDAYGQPPSTPAEAVARIARGGALDPTIPMVASALGMARTMLSVTPVSPANAGSLYPQGTAR
jgi:hypothetical protein